MSTAVNHRGTETKSAQTGVKRFSVSLDADLSVEVPPWAATQAVVVDGPHVREAYLTATPALKTDGSVASPGDLEAQTKQLAERLEALLNRIGLSANDLVTLDLFVDAGETDRDQVEEVIEKVAPERCPREALLVRPVYPETRICLQAYAVRAHKGVDFRRQSLAIFPELDVWGTELCYGGFRFLYVAGIPGVGAEKDSLRAHCDLMFSRAQQALERNGFRIQDVPRTHIYYFGPYQDLRDARHKYFGQQRVTDQELPASTGVPARPRAGLAVMRFFAVKPTADIPLVNRRVDPRTQSQAFAYGSLFSRARWIETDVARLEVSGTASMGRKGGVVYKGRPKQQALKTRENVMDLVDRCGLTASDFVRHLVYVNQPRHLDPWWQDLVAHSPRRKPTGVVTAVQAGVCWAELTIEEEATAVSLRLPGNST